ncbi:LysR family transcriptional regulator [Pseudomonas sp. GD03842]|uniref:LysR family transcriptional regulator n=1 Tax=unclassified Pseudomonas TaxID=196821 RepID=UPI000D374FF4|nr:MULTISPECIES: LysR family transcriptional regulator [unclassified Pseudomonas]MDH0746888.1 LysR family transcriptional regulator [Pseudomonas sp. GD03842]RAU43867.1 LysR family transcriptional regulator [Pseudomonas sp. RIT 409]RAU56239.1 LysR family transcriptional regulator [Pseudomonas sp. RIT 412]
MRGFDFEQLKTLVAVVDAGSISAAVSTRFLSQSSLSEQLRKLEEAAGGQLLVRSKLGVQATAAGERMVAHARKLLALSEAAWRDMHGIALEGELNLGLSDYFRPSHLMGLLNRIAEHHPGLRIRTQVGKSDDVIAAYRNNGLDLAIVMRIAGAARGAYGDARVLRTERLIWVMASQKKMTEAQKPVELALLPESCSLHRLARQQLDAHRRPYVIAHIASGVAGLQAAVGAGLGIGCLNASALIEPGMTEVPDGLLPALPDVEFVLLEATQSDPMATARLQSITEVIVETLAT